MDFTRWGDLVNAPPGALAVVIPMGYDPSRVCHISESAVDYAGIKAVTIKTEFLQSIY